MSSTAHKMRSLFMATIVVLSVVGGSVAFTGAAAANTAGAGNSGFDNFGGDLPDGGSETTVDQTAAPGSSVVVADSSFTTAGNVTNVTVNLTAGDPGGDISAGDVSQVTVTLRNSSSGVVASNTAGYSSHNTTVEFGSVQTEVDEIDVTAQTASTASDGSTIDAALYVQTNPTGVIDTAGVQTVNTNTGFISGSVTNGDTGDSLIGATVEVYRDTDTTGDISQGDTLVKTAQTNAQGVYTLEVAPDSNEYLLQVDQSGFQSFASAPLSVQAGSTTTQNVVLKTTTDAKSLDVTVQGDTTVPADGTSEVTHVVNLTGQDGQQTNQPIPGAAVQVDITRTGGSSGDITVDGTTYTPDTSFTTTQVTNASGQLTLNISSDTVQRLDVEYSFVNASSVTLSDSANANFAEIIQDGQGTVNGRVLESTDQGAETESGVSVYAIQQQRFNSNAQTENVSMSTYGASAGDTVSFRLVDNSTTDVVDVDDYYVVKNENGDKLTETYPLNESDTAAGNGFVYADLDNSGTANFTVVPLESGNYTVQIAPSESPSATAFANVSGYTTSDIPLDLTMSSIEQRYEDTTAVVSDTTDDDGRFELTNLYIGQANNGIDYVITAKKSGLTRDFITSTVTDNSETVKSLDLTPREPLPADTVNITNVGTISSGDASDAVEAFSDTTDATRQTVPRDGQTLDVIEVQTSNDAGPENGTVTLTVNVPASATFDPTEGGFVNVSGGTAVTDLGSNSITVETGSDGNAVVYLQADQSASTIDGNISANLQQATGSSAVDVTNKTFTGVTDFESASISGLVTNSNDEALPNSLVYVDEFDYGDTVASTSDEEFRFDLEPVQDPASVDSEELTFNITYQRYVAGTGYVDVETDTNVAFSTLTQADYEFEAFNNVSSSVGGVELATNTAGDASYSLEPVPASDTTDYRMAGVKLAEPDAGSTGAALTTVEPDVTGTANIVIAGAAPTEPADFTIDYTVDNTTVMTGENLTVTATVENTGDQDGDVTIEFYTGSDAFDTQTVTVGAGNSTTVSATTSFANAGTYEVSVNDLAPTSVTVTQTGPGDITGDGAPAQDLNNDGLYEDVNGDGVFDVADVQALFAASDSIENGAAFDFNEDGQFDIADVQTLFTQSQQ